MISCLENLRGGSGNVSGPQTVHSLGGVGGPWEAGITLGSRALLGVGGTCWRSLKVNPFLSQNNIAVLVLLWSNLTSRDICARRWDGIFRSLGCGRAGIVHGLSEPQLCAVLAVGRRCFHCPPQLGHPWWCVSFPWNGKMEWTFPHVPSLAGVFLPGAAPRSPAFHSPLACPFYQHYLPSLIPHCRPEGDPWWVFPSDGFL